MKFTALTAVLAVAAVAEDITQAHQRHYHDANLTQAYGHTGANKSKHLELHSRTPTAFPTQAPTKEWDGSYDHNGTDYQKNGTKHGHDDSDGNTLVNQDTHKHTFDHENFIDTNSTAGQLNRTYTEINVTGAPTAAPTSYPTDALADAQCLEGGTRKQLGDKYAGSGDNYCKQYECKLLAGGSYSSELVDTGLASVACGTPNATGTDVCQNIHCHYNTTWGEHGTLQVYHHKQQLNYEGGNHHCKYQENTGTCTCYCDGDRQELWQSYESWYCRNVVDTENDATRMAYDTSHSFMTAKHSDVVPGGANAFANSKCPTA
jgi:hypothetical protein